MPKCHLRLLCENVLGDSQTCQLNEPGVCSSSADDDEIPQELLLGKHQLSELSSESAKIKAMGIMHKVGWHLLSAGMNRNSFTIYSPSCYYKAEVTFVIYGKKKANHTGVGMT